MSIVLSNSHIPLTKIWDFLFKLEYLSFISYGIKIMEIKDHTCLADAINIRLVAIVGSIALRSHDMTSFFVALQSAILVSLISGIRDRRTAG